MCEIININGTTLIFSPLTNSQTASLGIFLKIGSRFEQNKIKGIAHFLEHMVFKGSREYSHRQIKREIEGRGGSLNAFTSQELTAYYAHFLSKNFKITLDILLDMVCHSLLKESDIKKERNVILEEIKMYNDLPSARAGMLLDRLLWQGHPLGKEIIGSSATVKGTRQRDLKLFRNKYYGFSNMVISFSGDIPKEKVINLLKRKIRKTKDKVVFKTKLPSDLDGLNIKCEIKNLEQSHLCLGFRSISYLSKRRLVAELLNIILGANMSSRLFEELREKKSLCYDISTELRKYKDTGSFVIHMGLDKNKVLLATTLTLRELKRIKEKNVSNKELLRAKDYMLGQITMSLEQPQGRMFYSAESYITLGKIYSLKKLKEEAKIITPTMIREFACDVFNFKSICISCVGNIEDNLETKIRGMIEKGGFYS